MQPTRVLPVPVPFWALYGERAAMRLRAAMRRAVAAVLGGRVSSRWGAQNRRTIALFMLLLSTRPGASEGWTRRGDRQDPEKYMAHLAQVGAPLRLGRHDRQRAGPPAGPPSDSSDPPAPIARALSIIFTMVTRRSQRPQSA
jgi:hypothetical protein